MSTGKLLWKKKADTLKLCVTVNKYSTHMGTATVPSTDTVTHWNTVKSSLNCNARFHSITNTGKFGNPGPYLPSLQWLIVVQVAPTGLSHHYSIRLCCLFPLCNAKLLCTYCQSSQPRTPEPTRHSFKTGSAIRALMFSHKIIITLKKM